LAHDDGCVTEPAVKGSLGSAASSRPSVGDQIYRRNVLSIEQDRKATGLELSWISFSAVGSHSYRRSSLIARAL